MRSEDAKDVIDKFNFNHKIEHVNRDILPRVKPNLNHPDYQPKKRRKK